MNINFPTASAENQQVQLVSNEGLLLNEVLQIRLLSGQFPAVPAPLPIRTDSSPYELEIYNRVYPSFNYREISLLCEQRGKDVYTGSGCYDMLVKDAVVTVTVGHTFQSKLVGPFTYRVKQRRPLLGFENDKSVFVVVLERLQFAPSEYTTTEKSSGDTQKMDVSVDVRCDVDGEKLINDFSKEFTKAQRRAEVGNAMNQLMNQPLSMELKGQSTGDFDQKCSALPGNNPVASDYVKANSVHFSFGLPDQPGDLRAPIVSDPRYFKRIQAQQYGDLQLTLGLLAGEDAHQRRIRQGLLRLQNGDLLTGSALLVAGEVLYEAATYVVTDVQFPRMGSDIHSGMSLAPDGDLEMYLQLTPKYIPPTDDNASKGLESGLPDSIINAPDAGPQASA